MQRPPLTFVHGVDIGAVLDKQLDKIKMAGIGGKVEAGAAGSVRYVDIREAGDDELCACAGIVRGSNVEGGLPVPVPAEGVQSNFKVVSSEMDRAESGIN